MSLKLLLTQRESALGGALEHELEREQFNLLLPADTDVDWADASSVSAYLRKQCPDLVINCRAWEQLGDVPGRQYFIETAAHLAKVCGELDIPLIHFSSYEVFGAENKVTHSEKDAVAPLNEIGEALVAAETEIAKLPKHIIVRLSWVIGAYGDNILTRLLSGLMAGAALDVNRRLRGAPTALSDAARVAVALVKQINCGADNWGVMHYCASDACSQEEFAEQVLQLLIQQQLLTAEPSLSVVEHDPINEPVSAILGCRRLRDYFGIQARSWRPSLLPLVKQWLHNREQH